jgi:hypothetical protein
LGCEAGGAVGAIQSSDRSDAMNPTGSNPGCDGGDDFGETS